MFISILTPVSLCAGVSDCITFLRQVSERLDKSAQARTLSAASFLRLFNEPQVRVAIVTWVCAVPTAPYCDVLICAVGLLQTRARRAMREQAHLARLAQTDAQTPDLRAMAEAIAAVPCGAIIFAPELTQWLDVSESLVRRTVTLRPSCGTCGHAAVCIVERFQEAAKIAMQATPRG